MVRPFLGTLTFVALFWAALAARAGEFEIDAAVKAGEQSTQTEKTRQTSTARTAAVERPIAEVTRDQPLHLSWRTRNVGKSEEYKDVLVHFFVVKQKQTGQTEVPKLGTDVAFEGAVTMDFKPQDHADWASMLKLHESGSYLFRVETIGLQDKLGHEYYAAMDIVVK